MQTLLVEYNGDLGTIWARFLGRQGIDCQLVTNAAAAYDMLRQQSFDVMVLDVELPDGEALAVADFATYRNPDIAIIAVTARGFFSDSAIFSLIPNARGLLREPLRPEDMAALDRALRPPQGRRGAEEGLEALTAQAAASRSRPCGASQSISGPMGTMRVGFMSRGCGSSAR